MLIYECKVHISNYTCDKEKSKTTIQEKFERNQKERQKHKFQVVLYEGRKQK
jgi:hypothetical protein